MVMQEKILVSVWATAAILVLGLTLSASGDTVAHWTFEEGTVDTVATGDGAILDLVGGHHGTPFNEPTYRSAVTPPAGRSGCISTISTNGSSFPTIRPGPHPASRWKPSLFAIRGRPGSPTSSIGPMTTRGPKAMS